MTSLLPVELLELERVKLRLVLADVSAKQSECQRTMQSLAEERGELLKRLQAMECYLGVEDCIGF